MNRKDFIKTSTLSIMGIGMFHKLVSQEKTYKADAKGEMPVLFVGHGNPMNAILKNKFSEKWRQIGAETGRPSAILCISAHWETKGTYITAMKNPRTIHDFGGFPKELFEQQYPASGSPALANKTKELIKAQEAKLDYNWGLDHGTWSVLLPMFPKADIPVFQMSIDYRLSLTDHIKLAADLKALRKMGVLIIASGNIVHNLSKMNFNNSKPYEWASEFDEYICNTVMNKNWNGIIEYQRKGAASKLAVPTNEHFVPLIYACGLIDKRDNIEVFNKAFDLGSISMTSYRSA